MKHRGVKYNYKEWITWNGKIVSGYDCDHFNFSPYYVASFATKTEAEMIARIDDYLDNVDEYTRRRELNNKAAQEFYDSMGEYKGD